MKGVMSTPNNPYSSNNDGRGDMPSYGDYSQGANDSYNSGYNSAYNEAHTGSYTGGYEQFPVAPEASLHGGGYAGAGKRLGALLIDQLVYLVVGAILIMILAGDDISRWSDQLNAYIDAGDANAPVPELETGGIMLASIIGLVFWFAYRAGMESTKGQTLGKMALGIKVVNADGQPISFTNSLLRNSWYMVVTVFGNIPAIGFVLVLAIYITLGVLISRNQYKQHSFDTWSKAYVVTTR